METQPTKGMLEDRYELREVIGRGGMGLVYRAYDRQVGRDVALKTLIDIQGRGALEQFDKERRVLASLHHPNLIEIFDFGYFQEHGVLKPFIVMPLLAGTTLGQLLRSSEAPGVSQAVAIVRQICHGLEAIHATGFVHRDIKPSNIFVTRSGGVKVIDFGVAHLVGANTITGMKGTPAYMSPEQICGEECKPVSDIFSLGVMCYEMLSGEHPFRGGSTGEILQATLYRLPSPLYERNPAVSSALAKVVHKALAKPPAQRISSAAEFAEWLGMALAGETPAVLDLARIQPSIDRAARAIEAGDGPMAQDILNELEQSGHVDPSLTALRRRVEELSRSKTIVGLLDRARRQVAEDEYGSALQTVESILRIDSTHQAAASLKSEIDERVTNRAIAACVREAEAKMDQGALTEARRCLEGVRELKASDARAEGLLQEIERRQQARRSGLQEKDESYQAALEAWGNGEFRAAAEKLQRVVDLERSFPGGREDAAQYAAMLERARSAAAAVGDFETKVAQSLAANDYEQAVSLCADHIRLFPGHPLTEGVSRTVEARRRQDDLRRAARIADRAAAEPRLAPRLALLRAGVESEPGLRYLLEPWITALTDQLAVVDRVSAKARFHEENQRYMEALDCWRMLGTIHPEWPGVGREVERLESLALGKQPVRQPFLRIEPIRARLEQMWASVAAIPRYRVDWRSPKTWRWTIPVAILIIGNALPQVERWAIHHTAAAPAPVQRGRADRAAGAAIPLPDPIPDPSSEQPEPNDPNTKPGTTASANTAGSESGAKGTAHPLEVYAGLDAFQVSVDNQRVGWSIRSGAMLIPNISLKRHHFVVSAEGHAPCEKYADVTAELSRVECSPAELFASLGIRGALPRTQVLIDGQEVGLTDGDGALDVAEVKPGDRQIELRNSPQYKSKAVPRTFTGGTPVVLEGDVVRLEKATFTANVTVTPAGAHLVGQCGQNSKSGYGSLSMECLEPVTVKADLDGYDGKEGTWQPGAGQTGNYTLALTRKVVIRKACTSAELKAAGWKEEKEWWAASRSPLAMPCTGHTGEVLFSIQSPVAWWTKTQWAWKSGDGKNDLTVSLGSLKMLGTGKKVTPDRGEDDSVQFRVVIEPAMVTAFVRANNVWVPIGEASGDTSNGQLVATSKLKMKKFTATEN